MQKYFANIETVEREGGDPLILIRSLDACSIDPESTRAAAGPLLPALPEFERCRSVRLKIAAQHKIANDAWACANAAKADGNTNIETANTKSYQAALSLIPVLEDELRPLVEAFEAARNALYLEKAVYLMPGPNTRMLEDAEYKTLGEKLADLKEHEKLAIEGAVIPDNRGVEYWRKQGGAWAKTKIEDVGVPLPPGAVLPEALTETQRAEIAAQEEAARTAALTPEQKAAEMEARINAVKREAALKKTEAEITGEDFDAKAWYQEKAAEIEAKYNNANT